MFWWSSFLDLRLQPLVALEGLMLEAVTTAGRTAVPTASTMASIIAIVPHADLRTSPIIGLTVTRRSPRKGS